MNTKQQQLASKEIEPLQQQSPQKSKKEDQLTSPQKKTSKSLMKKGAKQKKSGRGLTVSITATTAQSVEIKPSSVFKKFTKSTESSAQQPQQNNSQYKKVYAKQNMLKSLSVGIVLKYKLCSSDFKYSNPRRVITNPSTPSGNNGMDNADGNLILYVDDVLGGRYCVKDVLGQGTFGQVARCDDMQNAGVQVAVKVIKNKRAYLKQAEVETKILELLCKKYDPDDNHHIIRLHEHFTHQGHLCIVFELLSINLFELIKQNRFRGLSTNVISVFLSQILDALVVLREAKIIHCDMKPENILLTNDLSSPKNLIKLIDFGSACFENETVYSYIQSRFYRSPDVLFGLEYNGAIDVWSLGCICAELFLGLPLFPGVSQYNQVCRIVEMLGMPPAYIIETGRLSKKYFKRKTFLQSPDDHPYELKTEQEYCMENNDTPKEWKRYFNYKKLDELVKFYSYKSIPQEEHKKEEQNRLAFVDLLYGLLQWDPNQRWTPAQARKHPFVTGEPFTGPYVPEPDPIKLTVPMKIAQPSYFTPPTYYGSHGSHGTPQRKNSTQPMQYMSPHGGSFGGSMFGPNLGPSPNAAFFGSPHMTHQQQQQQQQQQHHPSGIPISRSHHHQQQYMQNSPYQNSPYIGVGASPNTGSSFNMPMIYGTPSSNSLSTSANSGSFFPSPQNNSRPWAKKKHHNNNNNHNYQQQSDVDQLGEQVGGVQLDNSPSRNRSSTWAAPPQVQINDQKVHGSRRNSTKGPPVRGKPPKHYNNNRRPDHESMDVPIDSDIARKSPSNEDDLDSDNWNPFFNDDIELEDGEDKQPANQPQNQSYNPYHSGNSQKFSGSYGPGNQTRNRSGSSYNKKGRNRSGSSFKRDNVGSFVSSSSYEGNAASYGTSIPGGLSYGNEHSNMYGFSPAASSFGIGSSPSSYGGSAGGSFMDQFKKGRNKPRPATSKQNNNK